MNKTINSSKSSKRGNGKKSKKENFTMDRQTYIEFLSMKSNMVSISNHNSKTGICCNNLALPNCTCREDAPCKIGKQCYCMHGTQVMATVQQAYIRNLRLYNTNPKDFWEQIKFIIKCNPLPLFRFHDCGEIPDEQYLLGMVDLSLTFPNIKFMAFTKKYDLINNYLDNGNKIPDNFNIIFSAWHNKWDVRNPYDLPVAYVDFTDKLLNPEFPTKITGCPNQENRAITCSTCQKCWNKNIKAIKFIQH